MSSIRPLADRVVIRRKEKETTSQGGIVLPDSSSEKPSTGEIVSVGSGKFEAGAVRPLDVKVGDEVLFGKYTGSEVSINGEDLLVLREEDIMGVIER